MGMLDMGGWDWLAAGLALVGWGTVSYIYGGYLLVLEGARRLFPQAQLSEAGHLPGNGPDLTILLTVHNEQGKVPRRIRDLLAQDYPSDRLEILVASDGSNDGTDEEVESLAGGGVPVRLLAYDRVGKSEAQNRSVPRAAGEVVVFTDVDTCFEPDFLRRLMEPFADPDVGCVTAGLLWRQGEGAVESGQGLYWRYEIRLRVLESRLGILAVASGQAMAVRKSAFRPLPAEVGEDCMIPLDVALQDLRVVHQPQAVAYDQGESDFRAEFRSRVRMTARNWRGTWLRPALLNPLRHPGYAFSLWSHKLLRWLSPVFLLLPLAAALPGLAHPVPQAVLALYLLGAAAVGLGWLQERGGLRVPGPWGTLFGFAVANLGFLIGVVQAVRGKRIVTYRSGQPSG